MCKHAITTKIPSSAKESFTYTVRISLGKCYAEYCREIYSAVCTYFKSLFFFCWCFINIPTISWCYCPTFFNQFSIKVLHAIGNRKKMICAFLFFQVLAFHPVQGFMHGAFQHIHDSFVHFKRKHTKEIVKIERYIEEERQNIFKQP